MKSYVYYILTISVVMLTGSILTGCKDKEDKDILSDKPENMEGYYMFTFATFLETIDIDGDGPILPTNNTLQFMYDLFDIYTNCPTEDTTIFEFKNYTFSHYCDFTGESSYIAQYTYNGDRFVLKNYEVIDPAGMFWEHPFHYFLIDQWSKVDGAWIIQGRCALGINVYPDDMKWFNYELKQIYLVE